MLKLDIQMFAVPFRKVSKTRKRMRRSHNALEVPGMVKCPNCGEMIKAHRVCPKCGSTMIIEIDRMNGYLGFTRVHGETRYNEAKNAEIADRVSM